MHNSTHTDLCTLEEQFTNLIIDIRWLITKNMHIKTQNIVVVEQPNNITTKQHSKSAQMPMPIITA